jgi:hypothetical protein
MAMTDLWAARTRLAASAKALNVDQSVQDVRGRDAALLARLALLLRLSAVRPAASWEVQQHIEALRAHDHPMPQNERLVHIEELTIGVP